uniref:Uncharacterized protein n=1 Tax=Arundo donax TaxID=35708 RepID=A0A0A9DIM2_ARUDO
MCVDLQIYMSIISTDTFINISINIIFLSSIFINSLIDYHHISINMISCQSSSSIDLLLDARQHMIPYCHQFIISSS